MAVPFPSIGPTNPTTLDLRQARFGPHWQPLPQDLVFKVSEGDDPPSGAGPRAGTLTDGPSAPVTVSAMEGDSDMEISDDDRPLPSSGGSCLQTHPPAHQEANDFLASLFLEPEVEGVWHGDGTVDEGATGVGSGTGPLTAGPSLVATIPVVDPPRAASLGERVGHGGGADIAGDASVQPPIRMDTQGGGSPWSGDGSVEAAGNPPPPVKRSRTQLRNRRWRLKHRPRSTHVDGGSIPPLPSGERCPS